PVRPPPGAPMFTFHIYAVLDKKFRFKQEHDTLLLCHQGGSMPFEITHLRLNREDYLLEAHLSIEESTLDRGSQITYWYGVKQRNREVLGTATRCFQIPFDRNIKIHLYEGFICRSESQHFFSAGLQRAGLKKSKGEEISKAWQTSASVLLSSIFQKWTPSHKQSTERLCKHLMCFTTSYNLARVSYPDNSHPPMVKASDMISESLVQILKGEPIEKVPESCRSSSPLLLGLSVFVVTRPCQINLGVRGWAKLCSLVSSKTAMEKKDLYAPFENPQTVVGLMNCCVQHYVVELVLLPPLLFQLRQPGADATKVGPHVEEDGWSGLKGVDFIRFRERFQFQPEKRMMLSFIQEKLPAAAEMPVLLMSWLALIPFDDLPEFSNMTGISVEHLIQSLFYRLRKCGEKTDLNKDKENVKLADKSLSHILLKVDKERELSESGNLQSVFMSSINVLKYTCKIARIVPWYQTVVQAFQLVLKLAESAIVVQSAARFRDNMVVRLLDPQSAINFLLSNQVDDMAGHMVHSCLEAVHRLVVSLLEGSVSVGDLQTCLKYREQFKRLYQQKTNTKSVTVPVDAKVVLSRREEDLNAFTLRRQEIDTLMKMLAKITESLTPEMSTLEAQHSADLSAVSLNKLVLVQAFDAEGKLPKIGSPQVLWYRISMNVLKMSSEMHKLHHSNLILSWWVKRAESVAASLLPSPPPVQMTLTQISDNIWKPLLMEFFLLGVSIAGANITFSQLDQVLEESGDQGDGKVLMKELDLMSEMVSAEGKITVEENWVQSRLCQIQRYRQLHDAAAAASAILRIAERMMLSGNFTDSFKQRVLGSLSDDLFSAGEKLSAVNKKHTACLEEFLKSETLISWVTENLRMSDVKVYVELASISAGENDAEIDQVACFHDAVMGYGPLLYTLSPKAGFQEIMKCAQQVWDAQSRDDKLPDKLRESTRLLSWLKALKETHGSVEQSSLSLASSINTHGVYRIGWSNSSTEKFQRCLQNMVLVTVKMTKDEKGYKLEDLLELQNKLMLMSSKGEHGREQVNRFTEFRRNMSLYLDESLDIVRLAHLLMCLSETNQQHMIRNLPPVLQEGKPNLVLCPSAEVFTTTLSFYMESPELPLPSFDEVLVCREQTTKEDVELFLRRALCQTSTENWQKIYSLVNPGVLGYEAGEALVELYEGLERSAGPHYRLVIVSSVVHQHRYVPSYFSNYKVQAGVSLTAERARRYLHHHFTLNTTQNPVALVSPDQLSVWIVSSVRPAVKSLYVERLFEKFQQKSPRAKHVRIRLIEASVDVDSLVATLTEKLLNLREQDPILLHIDSAGVRSGLEELLFHLLILGCLSDSHGVLWRKNDAHLITVEVLKTNTSYNIQAKEFDPLVDKQEFISEGIQRPYQYLQLYSQNRHLDRFNYQKGSIVGSPSDCLRLFLRYCGMENPSWGELKNFSWFMNVQLKDCENSVFCDPDFLADQLPGFKDFIVKFMILMARDFASPSLNTSDESPASRIEGHVEDDLLTRLAIRKRWENESHPYIFFNADHFSMSFLGFNVQFFPGQNTLKAVDPHSGTVLIENIMTQALFEGLQRQRISLTEDFDKLSRSDKIKRISCVVGAKRGIMDKSFDPDPTYELTVDNVMKMLAIHMRFRCGIPVVIMGETGCGKTRLVRFLCTLQREDRPVENMVLVKVHGGTTAEMIYRKVREAEELAHKNQQNHHLDTILFFDEANTTEAIFAIKEILCDQTVKGEPLRPQSGLRIIAACNPYRKHSPEMVKRLEHAGLGYRVKADETEDRLGKVPLRQLVYRVHPLPPSMVSLVWDFGQLSDLTELSYIKQIVQKTVSDNRLPAACQNIISNVLAASQKYMRSRKNECSFVSLRDVERSMKVLVWFYQHSSDIFPNVTNLSDDHRTLKCLILAVGVCYYPSLVAKEKYLAEICMYFPRPMNSVAALQEEISTCQDLFLQNVQTRETIAKNIALKENVFLMVVCIELRIPLFLVGKPGSSKSLAKTVVADAMQGQNSHCELFKKLKQVHMVSFQCSPHSSPEGIIGTFRNCARFQKDKNMDEYVSVVVLDEIGLAEDSPQMPLKTLHPLLEDGCIDNDKPDPHMKVGFVGISNWALDPAKMNRGIFVSRWDPSEDELVETAKGICSSSKQILLKIKHLFPSLAKAFLKICNETSKNQFFGLRDYYSLVKMLFAAAKATQQEPNKEQLVEVILRNFSGQPEGFDTVFFFQEVLQDQTEIPRPRTLQMILRNLDHETNEESRYLLLLTTNNAALHILQQKVFAKGDCPPPEIVFGSGFPKDQEYAQICRNVNRVKTCMETGRTVILLNMQNLYESLYDALNQYYVYLSKQQYVDLGLGSHRVKCRVHKNFRLIVVEDQKKVYKHFPVPLINRLEKHRVDRSTDLEAWQHRILNKLREWIKKFSREDENDQDFKVSDIFIGFHSDACASALLQALEKRQQAASYRGVIQNEPNKPKQPEPDNQDQVTEMEQKQFVDAMETEQESEIMDEKTDFSDDKDDRETLDNEELMQTENDESAREEEEEVLDLAKSLLLNCATPDAVVRLKDSELSNQDKEKLQRLYFQQQNHHSLREFLEACLKAHQDSSKFLEITTFSSLLTKLDVRVVANALGLHTDRILLLSLHQFDTEVSFCNKITFLRNAGSLLHILLIQMDLEESQCSDELIASAYCIMNYMASRDTQVCWVVFIVKVSRITSQSQYIGFQGFWHSVHIDDLRDSEDMSLDLSNFCGTLIVEMIKNKVERAHLDGLSLVRSCIQKAVGLLRDPEDLTSRGMQRMHILLMHMSSAENPAARFQSVLLSQLAEALAQREEMMLAPKEWVSKEAKKRQALQEGGTLHTLWRCLQSAVTPVLASILEVIDRYSNLDLLCPGRLSPGLLQLWMDILADSQILNLTPPSNPDSDQEVLVQHHFLLESGEQPCSAPFSWIVKMNLDSLWEESEFMPSKEGDTERIVQFVSSFSSSTLGRHLQQLPEEQRWEYGLLFLHDFLLLSFKIKTKEELEVEDVLALGICVEQIKLSTLRSLDECKEFVGRVELLQPCLDRAFSQKYGALCGKACFLMQESPDMRSLKALQQLIRILNSFHDECISRDLVCLLELTEPCVLPCQHVICLPCLQNCVQQQRHSCPKCRRDLPNNFRPTVSHSIK
uniref:RING-type E3 ubiquitin transferase n=1 Tax=Cyprinodon variegatus TaxID=28743 RepID=A0A3Q2DU59_CYPVA